MRVISGRARGAKLVSIESENTRPTLDRIKETMFNLFPTDFYNKIILDLFSGSGALGIEALSRGAKECHFVDVSKEAMDTIQKNLLHTKLVESSTLHNIHVEKSIELFTNSKIFDIIFIDPPYNMGFINDTLNRIVEKNILKENGLIMLEASNKESVENSRLTLLKAREYRISSIYLYTLAEE